MSNSETFKVKIDMNHGKPITDPEATTSCPKYNFQPVEISSMCTRCEYFHGVKRAINLEKTKERAEDWHIENAVTCAFPMQRRISKKQHIIKG